MTDSHGRWEGFGMNIYVWALKFSSLQPTWVLIALSYCVEWGGARKIFFSWISDRESLSQALCENWGPVEIRMFFLYIWWEGSVLIFVLSTCFTTLLHKLSIPKPSSLYLAVFTVRKDTAVLSGPLGSPLLCLLEE